MILGASCCMCNNNKMMVGNGLWHTTQVEVEVDGVTAARAVGPAGM